MNAVTSNLIDDCSSIERLKAFVACKLTSYQSDQIESHLQKCPSCLNAFVEIVESSVSPRWHNFSSRPDSLDVTADFGELSSIATGMQLFGSVDGNASDAFEFIRSTPKEVGKYRVIGVLGSGGMGIVYAAWDEFLKRKVALKLLRQTITTELRATRAMQEAVALGRLSHPNIVNVFEIFAYESKPVLSMEFIDGLNLAQWQQGRLIDPKQTAKLILQLADALHYAHSKGVVHRDLKPSNIMLEFEHFDPKKENALADCTPKLTDFGMAKLMDERSLTLSGDVLGTPSYMAPEQASGALKQIGPITDVYGLGAILYELLTGRAPFLSNDPVVTLSLVRNTDPIAPIALVPSTPLDLNTICLKCLEKLPSQRYASVDGLVEELRAYMDGRPIRSRPIGVSRRIFRWCRRNPTFAIMAAMIVLALATIVSGSLYFGVQQNRLRANADDNAKKARLSAEQAIGYAKEVETQKKLADQHLAIASQSLSDIEKFISSGLGREAGKSTEVRDVTVNALSKIYLEHISKLGPAENWSSREVEMGFRSLFYLQANLEYEQAKRLVSTLESAVSLQYSARAMDSNGAKMLADLVFARFNLPPQLTPSAEYYHSCAECWRRIQRGEPDWLRGCASVAYYEMAAGEAEMRDKKFENAEKFFLSAVQIERDAFAMDPHEKVRHYYLADKLQKVSIAFRVQEKLALAKKACKDARSEIDLAPKQVPEVLTLLTQELVVNQCLTTQNTLEAHLATFNDP